MHPYRVDFIYAELSRDFDINSVMADIVERDGIFDFSANIDSVFDIA